LSLSFVIPTRNEVERLSILLPQICEKYPESKIYIIDTPTLETPLSVTKALVERYGAEIIELQAGFGSCLVLGLKHAKTHSDYIITMDADHDINSAGLMYETLTITGDDLAIGIEDSKRLPRMAMNVFLKNLLGIYQKNPTCGLRCYRSELINKILPKQPDEWFFIQIELLYNAIQSGAKVIEVPFPYKAHGKATENFNSYKRFFVGLLKLYLKTITS
jgi:glycosyltransferase involved in cell wall biosynthesis